MGIKLIGITGKARSGKDTLAKFLQDEHGFVRMSFADPVKIAAFAAFGWPQNLIGDDDFKKYKSDYWGITVREALQKFGTEAIRGTFGADHWVKRWMLDYAKVSDTHSVVVTDVREELEATAVRDLGGLIIHLHRDDAGLTGREGAHSSENGIEMNSRDVNVFNNQTLNHLEHEAYMVIQFIEQNANAYKLRNATITEA